MRHIGLRSCNIFKWKEWLSTHACGSYILQVLSVFWVRDVPGFVSIRWLCKGCVPVARLWCAQFAVLPVCCRLCRVFDFVAHRIISAGSQILSSSLRSLPDCVHSSLVLPFVTICSSLWVIFVSPRHSHSQRNSVLQLHSHHTRPASWPLPAPPLIHRIPLWIPHVSLTWASI